MPSLELCPLGEHLDEGEISVIITHLKESDVDRIKEEKENPEVTLDQNYDDDIFVDFFDQLDANDAACEIYLPEEFEDTFKVEGIRIGSAPTLLLVLANMKEDMFVEEEEEEESTDEGINDELDEFDDYDNGDDNFSGSSEDSEVELKDEQMRRVWKVVNRAAQLAISKKLALFVHE